MDPTTDQIRILKELYYNDGVRSPSPDQIKRICARLKQYGKVKGKNVFYWFQNHKARQRQKKRLTTTEPVVPKQKTSVGNGDSQYPTSSNEVSPMTVTSTGMLVVEQMGSRGGYGSGTMEIFFRDCSISVGGSTNIDVGVEAHNFRRMGVDYYASLYSTIFERRKHIDLENGEEVEENQEVETLELVTLPLFPMHREDIKGFCSMKCLSTSDGFDTTWYQTSEESGSRTSLELSLSSYSGRFVNETQ